MIYLTLNMSILDMLWLKYDNIRMKLVL